MSSSWHFLRCASCPIDIASAGLPCKAYSKLRDRTGSSAKTKGSMAHPACETVYNFLEYLGSRKPGSWFVEEVPGFGHVDSHLKHNGVPESHLCNWVRQVCNMGYSVRVLEVKHEIWVQNRRTRLLLVGCSAAHGGGAGASWIAEALQAIMQRRSLQRALSVWDLVNPDDIDEERVRARDTAERRKQALTMLCWVGVTVVCLRSFDNTATRAENEDYV